MRVLIYGVNSTNKGAELLLTAASARLAELGHEAVVNVRDVDRRSRSENAVRGVFSVERLRSLRSFGLDRLPRSASALLPISGDSSFDYVLDASGYSLTEAWGRAPVVSRLSRLQRWTSKGIGFSMLPQAFGPFGSPEIRDGVRKISQYSDSIWARDSASLTHLNDIGVESSLVHQAPDITIPLQVSSVSEAAKGAVVIVPNWNLAKRAGPGGGAAYVNSLKGTAKDLIGRGIPVMGLCHEGAKDRQIVEEVASEVRGMTVLSPISGYECKRIIAGSMAVVAGRYHALVSALSSGVPAIGHSWSHKYAALMEDFAVVDGLADPFRSEVTIARFDSLNLSAERTRLKVRVSEVAARLDTVWAEVDQHIRER